MRRELGEPGRTWRGVLRGWCWGALGVERWCREMARGGMRASGYDECRPDTLGSADIASSRGYEDRMLSSVYTAMSSFNAASSIDQAKPPWCCAFRQKETWPGSSTQSSGIIRTS
jgi:hypothetical protein